MVNSLLIVDLLGEKWFVDERLGEYRSVCNGDKPIIFFGFRDMDNMLELKDMLENVGNFDVGIDTEKKLRTLYNSAMMGDRSAVDNIAAIFDDTAS